MFEYSTRKLRYYFSKVNSNIFFYNFVKGINQYENQVSFVNEDRYICEEVVGTR